MQAIRLLHKDHCSLQELMEIKAEDLQFDTSTLNNYHDVCYDVNISSKKGRMMDTENVLILAVKKSDDSETIFNLL